MSKLFSSRFSKLYKILSLTLLLSLVASNAIAQESDYHGFPTGEQEGGGVRGKVNNCSSYTSYPIPLIPQNSQTLTTSATPKLFFDAANVQQAVALDFLLLNQNDEIVYQDLVEADNKSGLISLNVSDESNSDSLKIDDIYHWYMVQQCENTDTPKIVANGSLKRIKLEDKLAKKLTKASLIEKINIYQEANVWYEALENLTQLKCSTSNSSITDKQIEQISSMTNTSIESFNSSLDSYCAASLEAQSIVMK